MSDPKPDDVAGAINALTTYLRSGSPRDPDEFSPEQLRIQRDFRALLTGLGRADTFERPGRLPRPVLLTKGRLRLKAPLPAKAVEIGGYTRRRGEVWRISVADATTGAGASPTDLRHKDIVTAAGARVVARIWVFDSAGRPLLVGFPEPSEAAEDSVVSTRSVPA